MSAEPKKENISKKTIKTETDIITDWKCQLCGHTNDAKHKTCCYSDEYCTWCSSDY